MSQEIFRKLRQMLMEKLDVYRELTDQEILETIDELIVNTLRESGVSLKRKKCSFARNCFIPSGSLMYYRN
mgnify:CR=1 FL=1